VVQVQVAAVHVTYPSVIGCIMSINLTGLTEVFQRGSANVIWCEHVLETLSTSKTGGNDEVWMAEFYNSISNSAFVIASFLGLWRVANNNGNGKTTTSNLPAILAAELVLMIGVGVGSFLFHSHQSRAAQIADELPMSLLALAYNYCLRGLHPITTDPKLSRIFYQGSLALVGGLWAVYVCTNIYDVFLFCFTSQVISTLAISYDAGRRANHPPTMFFTSLFFLVAGKLLWEYERYLYKNDMCDAPGTKLLHPLWHIGAALSHYYCMLNTSLIAQKLQAIGRKQL
jgi:Ceramidase